jgi:beta-galactosidase
VLAADGTSLSYVAATLTDARGTVVPHADNLIQFSVSGPATLTATDNGRQENAYGYTVPSMPAFNGRALAVVGATREPGTIRVTAAVEGLLKATVTLASVPASLVPGIPGTSAAGVLPSGEPPSSSPAGAGPTADASYSGAPNTLPSAMLDGDLSTTWSNFYSVPATANLLAVSSSNPSDWVSLSWESPQQFSGLTAYFTTGGALALPASIEVTYWDGTGRGWAPAVNVKVSWATASNEATTITFDPVRTSSVRLTMTSPAPGTAGGFLAIAELSAVTG